jgi:hypothetical protein
MKSNAKKSLCSHSRTTLGENCHPGENEVPGSFSSSFEIVGNHTEQKERKSTFITTYAQHDMTPFTTK